MSNFTAVCKKCGRAEIVPIGVISNGEVLCSSCGHLIKFHIEQPEVSKLNSITKKNSKDIEEKGDCFLQRLFKTLTFKEFIAPLLIKIIFYLGIVVFLLTIINNAILISHLQTVSQKVMMHQDLVIKLKESILNYKQIASVLSTITVVSYYIILLMALRVVCEFALMLFNLLKKATTKETQ